MRPARLPPSVLAACALCTGLRALAACGGPPAEAPAGSLHPPPAAVSAAAPPDAPLSTPADPSFAASAGPTSPAAGPASALPDACADPGASECTPPSAFVERLCAKAHQDVAFALFAKKAPFSRFYLRGRLDELLFDEEVLALRFHPVPRNGIQVGSASGSYDVLRWDGSCAMAVDADMLSRVRPAKPKVARVKWHRVGDRTQDALIASSDDVKRAHAKRGRECKGAMSGEVSAECEKADAALGDAIVEFVRAGGALPPPELP